MTLRDATEYQFATATRRLLVRQGQVGAEGDLAEAARQEAEQLPAFLNATDVNTSAPTPTAHGATAVVVTATLPPDEGSAVAVHGVLRVNLGTSSGVIRLAVGKRGSRRVRGPGPRGPPALGSSGPGPASAGAQALPGLLLPGAPAPAAQHFPVCLTLRLAGSAGSPGPSA